MQSKYFNSLLYFHMIMYTFYKLMGGCVVQRQTPCIYKRILYVCTQIQRILRHTLKLHHDRSFKQRLLQVQYIITLTHVGTLYIIMHYYILQKTCTQDFFFVGSLLYNMPPSCTYTYCETFFFSKPSAIKAVDFIVNTHFHCQRISVQNSKIAASQRLQYTILMRLYTRLL